MGMYKGNIYRAPASAKQPHSVGVNPVSRLTEPDHDKGKDDGMMVRKEV